MPSTHRAGPVGAPRSHTSLYSYDFLAHCSIVWAALTQIYIRRFNVAIDPRSAIVLTVLVVRTEYSRAHLNMLNEPMFRSFRVLPSADKMFVRRASQDQLDHPNTAYKVTINKSVMQKLNELYHLFSCYFSRGPSARISKNPSNFSTRTTHLCTITSQTL